MMAQQADKGLEGRMRNMIISNTGAQDRDNQQQLDQTDGAPKQARKRPNQAQRREMAASLTIPVDTRASVNVGRQRNDQYQGNQSYQNRGHHQQQQQHRGGFQQHRGTQRPQSAGYQQSSFGGFGHYSQQRSAGFIAPSPYGQPHPPSFNGPSPSFPPYDTNNAHQWQPAHQGPNFDHASSRGRGGRQNYHHGRFVRPQNFEAQAALLGRLCHDIIVNAEIEVAEIQEKEAFRIKIEDISRKVITEYEVSTNGIVDFPTNSVQLRCFGSLASGFATKDADMDLGLLSPFSRLEADSQDSAIPRLLEKAFLDAGLGARLLTKTRVPIIKLCEIPGPKLRKDLLEARDRWEKGLEVEHEVDIAGTQPDAVEDATENKDIHGLLVLKKRRETLDRVTSPTDEAIPETREQMIANFKQPIGQSLSNYEAHAKRLLRKLDGRDITLSTANEFTVYEYQLLTDVSLAYIRGLEDEDLKTRLLSYASLSLGNQSPMPKWRSLQGVFLQVHGELLVRMWGSRKVFEKDEVRERQAAAKINSWKTLQNKPSFGLDTVGFNKELQNSLELLKTIPSLQIMGLTQSPTESAKSYHSRAEQALTAIGEFDRIMPGNTVLPIVVDLYIKGMRNQEWKELARQEAESMDAEVNLRSVARHHKALQLASEYEKALDKELYPDAHIEDIKAYITILRSPLARSMVEGQVQFLIPIAPDTRHILPTMKSLSDPAKFAPNQPRDPYRDSLEFPKHGIGVQCDINFSAQLAMQNTLLLRCYAATDPRVRLMVLFVKHWAKARSINTTYRGTLSSYGYVLMVLHYLVNIAQPFVCPNLQHLAPQPPPNLSEREVQETVEYKGHNIQFWRDEDEMKRLSAQGTLNQNNESVGELLRGFFEYYGSTGFLHSLNCRGFDWGREVLSLRTPGGTLTKQEKGWTGAKTTVVNVAGHGPSGAELTSPVDTAAPNLNKSNNNTQSGPSANAAAQQQKPAETKEIRHRYLFAIEDPFELDHNVARTVTHNGIVAIRDEFRRAVRILKSTSLVPEDQEENLMANAAEEAFRTEKGPFWELLTEIHGVEDGAM